jgi:GNAT superfamily N-acetyltransferase
VRDFEITRVQSDDDIERYYRVNVQLNPESAADPAETKDRLERHPTQRQFLATVGGEDVAIAACGEPHGAQTTSCWTQVDVLSAHRGQGIGRALAAKVIEHVASLGKEHIDSWVLIADASGVRFAESYGLREVGRIRELRLDLSGPAQEVELPDGLVVKPYAELEDVDRGMYEVAVETVPDMPAPEPLDVGDYAQWEGHDLHMIRTSPGLTTVALMDGTVVGYAVVSPRAGGRVGQHRGTFVLRAHRGRGIARALKQVQIEAARRQGIEVLLTQNADSNLPMRRVNERLGYRPAPDRLWMRGPVPAA